jgi:hypothetical protein
MSKESRAVQATGWVEPLCTCALRRTTQWSGRPTAQALFLGVALYLWAAAHRER